MRRLGNWFTKRTSVPVVAPATGKVVSFSRACGATVPVRPNGLPSPNSAAAELVREFLGRRPSATTLKDLAEDFGREPRRFYNEAEGEAVLSWDSVDRRGAALSLEDRLILGRFLMDRWGLSVTVGPIPRLEA